MGTNTIENKNFFTLCKKARLASSIAKLNGCYGVYSWKSDYLSQIVIKFPDRVEVMSVENEIHRIKLNGFGEIHLKIMALTEAAREIVLVKTLERVIQRTIA